MRFKRLLASCVAALALVAGNSVLKAGTAVLPPKHVASVDWIGKLVLRPYPHTVTRMESACDLGGKTLYVPEQANEKTAAIAEALAALSQGLMASCHWRLLLLSSAKTLQYVREV